jgi:hypothetical protein
MSSTKASTCGTNLYVTELSQAETVKIAVEAPEIKTSMRSGTKQQT